MKKKDKVIAILYPLALLIVSAIGTTILINSYSTEKYSSDADSLIIPLSAIALTLLAQLLLFTFQLPYYKHSLSTPEKPLFKKTIAVLSSIASLAIYAWIIEFWDGTINLSLQIIYIIAAIAFCGLQYRVYKKQ
ncbi:hypothetical protein ACIOWE_10325 [Pseudomonas sp. NPDC087598]|uniref:hypothetical protein n=1 Tax=Pseudomonas sp. NPDC087598 TaxID=3364440 RepID=UPI00382C43EB